VVHLLLPLQQQLLYEKFLLRRDAEIKVEQLQQAPFDACSDICEYLIVHIFAILDEDVP